jgi:endonuclease/exonuclease/phosphatase family metal-dependent hydrolase
VVVADCKCCYDGTPNKLRQERIVEMIMEILFDVIFLQNISAQSKWPNRRYTEIGLTDFRIIH